MSTTWVKRVKLYGTVELNGVHARVKDPVKTGDRLYFEDMAIYSMVKNNTFNGMALPAIWKMDAAGDCTLVKKFGYEDFKGRLS